MFHEIAQNYQGKLSAFTPYAPITDRNAWDTLAEDWKKEALCLGESYLGCVYPHLSATDFMDFLRTGNRTRYEDKLFAKRHALNALVLAECVENKGRFLDDIINGIFSVCEESAWQLPAHNSYIRDTPQLPLPDLTDPVLDLFACETGSVLASVHYLLQKTLDGISPFITKRIRHELEHRILRPYLDRHFWWMGNGKEPMNNWTIWCTQNVLLSLFLTDFPDEAAKSAVFHKACQSADFFLAEYGQDGCCDEGAQYYRHAGLCLFNVMEILNAVTDGAFVSLYREEKIKNIASYILNVHIGDKYYVNFADCSPVAGRAGVREFLFAERTGNESMMRFAAQDFHAGGTDSLLLPSENNLFYRLQNAFTTRRITQYRTSHPAPAGRPDIFYPSAGVFLARDGALTLAVKAGDNGDSHNHNDTGSFTVYKNNLPMFIDVGVESYTKKTFSPRRYEIWTMQSAYHNLPTVNGFQQKDGECYGAKDVVCHMGDTLCDIDMDISGAYPAESGLTAYRRRAALYKGKEILIHDRFSFAHTGGMGGNAAGTETETNPPSVILSLMTYEKPLPAPSAGGLCFQIGTLGTLTAESGSGSHSVHSGNMENTANTETINIRIEGIEEIPVTDPRLKTAWEHNIYRILLRVTGGEVTLRIS